MIVRIVYENGSTEAHALENGVHVADLNGARDIPGAKLAYKLGDRQVRHLTVVPSKKDTIARVELVNGEDRSAPLVIAATVEDFE